VKLIDSLFSISGVLFVLNSAASFFSQIEFSFQLFWHIAVMFSAIVVFTQRHNIFYWLFLFRCALILFTLGLIVFRGFDPAVSFNLLYVPLIGVSLSLFVDSLLSIHFYKKMKKRMEIVKS
jgi:hypothetical protein